MTLILLYLVVLILVAVVLFGIASLVFGRGETAAAAAGGHHGDGAAGLRSHRGRRRGGQVHPGAAGLQDQRSGLGAGPPGRRTRRVAGRTGRGACGYTEPVTDGRIRCPWADGGSELYRDYHDQEWGRPLRGRTALFERMTLEAFQSGLSWLIILRKRENFRRAFAGFDIEAVARFTDRDVARLLADAGIVRNRAKIEATVGNAQAAAELDVDLSDLLWSFARRRGPDRRSSSEVPAQTPESKAMAKELKKRGFRFVGPTTAYALMQATGMVDDHVANCWVPLNGS